MNQFVLLSTIYVCKLFLSKPFRPCITNTEVQIMKLFAGNAAGS